MTRSRLAALLATPLLIPLAAGAQSAISVTRLVSGLSSPVFVTTPPADLDRLFIVEQHSGQVRIYNRGTSSLNATPFLTVADLSSGSEQGLLGLAFHPNYASNGFLFVNFTAADGHTVVRRYHVSGDPDIADAGSATSVIEITQPQSNHNGGWIAFGPDGFLYVGMGDGGSGNDQGSGHTEPGGNAQDITNNLLGKMLRLDVDGDDFPGDPTRNYAIPSMNPFVGITGDDEIWAYGLRNPWRSSFDRLTGDLYIGDVGQGAREEIDVQPSTSIGGENYGWRLREGTIQTPAGVGGAQPPGAINPIYDYSHGGGTSQGYSVTGGYVYRGPVTALQGYYIFSDYVSSRLWMFKFDGSTPGTYAGNNITDFADITDRIVTDVGSIGSVSSFGEDPAGNLFIVDHAGEVFEITNVISSTAVADAFKLYKLRAADGAPRFAAFGPVSLADELRTADYAVTKVLQLGSPAAIDGVAVNDATTHLVEYKVATSAPPLDLDVSVINTCHALNLSLSKAQSLLVPANADAMSDPVVPNPAMHDVNHFVCYKARSHVRLTKGSQIDVVDNFDGGQTRRYNIGGVSKLCVPTAKSGAPAFLSGTNVGASKAITPATIEQAGQYLLCYRVKLSKSSIAQAGCRVETPGDTGTPFNPPQARHTRVYGLHTNDQFGVELIDTAKETEICLPTVPLP